jgi:hypothetical protein
MRHPLKKLSEVNLRPEPHVQAVIETQILNSPEKQVSPVIPIAPKTMRLNCDVDADLYTEAIIKARRQGKKLSEVVRDLLTEYLSK